MAEDLVSVQGGVDNLAGYFFVGETGNKSVFHSVEFVLVLHGKTFSGVIVGFSFSTTTELSLKSLEVGVIFVDFYEGHLRYLLKKYLLN